MTLVKNNRPPEQFGLQDYRKALISWGKTHFRDFPWRYTTDPYHVLLAETLLHRTQAKQVVGVYLEFISLYPDVASLNRAPYDEIKELLKPLGLYWRTDLIVPMAEELVQSFEGEIPVEKSDLLSLPGVGDYIASSVRCFAFNKPDAIIDTNVVRVVTRIFDVPRKDSLRRNKGFRELVQYLIDPKDPRAYNYAMLDLANMVCRPRKPDCHLCPLRGDCEFYRLQSGGSLE